VQALFAGDNWQQVTPVFLASELSTHATQSGLL
jgi:hypothetical protein